MGADEYRKNGQKDDSDAGLRRAENTVEQKRQAERKGKGQNRFIEVTVKTFHHSTSFKSANGEIGMTVVLGSEREGISVSPLETKKITTGMPFPFKKAA